MSRTVIVVVAGLMVAGCIVAMLPAQESSRRRVSSYQPPMDPTLASEAGAAGIPQAEYQPLPAAGGGLSGQLQATGQEIVNEFAAQPGGGAAPAFTPAPDNPAPYQPPEEFPAPQGPAETNVPEPAPMSPAEDSLPMNPLPLNSLVSPPPAEVPGAAVTPAQPAADLPPIVDRPASGQLRSVLKRPQEPVVTEAAPPTTSPGNPAAPATSAAQPSRTGSSRRVGAAPATSAPTADSLRASTAFNSRPASSIQDLAVSGRSPALRVDVAGPSGITVGKPAVYVVSLVNESDSAAADVQVRVTLPTWVNVSSSQPTSGDAQMQADVQGGGRLVWTIPQVAGRSHEQLRLQLVTSEGDAFDVGLDWTCRPASTRASIVVKQPQLDISLAGPADMIFGETKVFTLTVSNPGNGDAERVVVNIVTGDGRSQPVEVGLIPAGRKKEIPLEVVANQAGEMGFEASATGEGGLEAQVAGKVLVRKAELNIAVAGPPLKFAGTEATYLVTVANTGNALADNVNLSLALPTAAKYIGGIDGAAAAAGSIKWKVSSLPPGSERQYEVRVQLQAAGLNRLIVQANAAAAGTASSQAETTVEAISDLKLVVNDPAGPLPVGEQAVYEVQVVNRGSEAAEQVKIVVQFGEGIEPIAFDGCEAKIVPGQVLCQPLPTLGAGEQVTLRIKAKPQAAGTHQFRVEVTAADADTRLVSEGTTRFFSESGGLGAAASTAKKPTLQPSPVAPGTIQR